jgi:thiamine biosynthesis lipoprotein
MYDDRMKRLAVASLLASALFFISSPAPPAEPVPLVRYEGSRLSMGCVYSIVVYGGDAAPLPRIVDAALDEVDRIDRLMSHYKPDSPLSRLNRTAPQGPMRVEPELFDFIGLCLKYSRDSDGAFDITVGPLMKAWGFFRGEGRIPGDPEISELRTRIGYQHVIVDAEARAIRFDRPGLELDLGGIAKGYAVDRAVSVLQKGQVTAALVSAGGSTVYGLGAPPGRNGWEVGLQDPIDPRKIARRVLLKDRALSISGTAEKSFEVGGVRYSHIMDPRTGRPVQGVLSVAVLARSGTAGDALDDAFFVEGAQKTREHLKRLPGTEAFFFLPVPHGKWKMVRVSG